ncbi:MAG TPA: ferredoxin, partial [Candidatus Methanoperedenaceae archaeon]|nr:ferredoxin [Candidatus Methanoperedenaceae archaeon]
DAAEVTKPFEGEIKLIDVNLKGCDPVGCHGCFNVCPAHAWYVPADKKIDVVKDFCIYCGACEKACHVFAIKTSRNSVRHTPLIEAPWKKDWERAITSLVDGNRALPDISRAIEVPPAPGKPLPEEAPVKLNHEFMEKVRKRIDAIKPELRNVGVRRAWERKNGGEVVRRMRRGKSLKE